MLAGTRKEKSPERVRKRKRKHARQGWRQAPREREVRGRDRERGRDRDVRERVGGRLRQGDTDTNLPEIPSAIRSTVAM